ESSTNPLVFIPQQIVSIEGTQCILTSQLIRNSRNLECIAHPNRNQRILSASLLSCLLTLECFTGSKKILFLPLKEKKKLIYSKSSVKHVALHKILAQLPKFDMQKVKQSFWFTVQTAQGSILLTGRLLEFGWSINHKVISAFLFDLTGRFNCDYTNYFWTKVVHRFLKKYLPEAKVPHKPVFCVQCAKSKTLDIKSHGVYSNLPRDKHLDLCMTDVAGPFDTDINGCCFLLTMRDHTGTYTFCEVLASRSQSSRKNACLDQSFEEYVWEDAVISLM
ncbi:uncharacterized protein VP01_1357g1, partial [Puccinia sorghi]